METGKIVPPEITLPAVLTKAFERDRAKAPDLQREVESGLELLAAFTQSIRLPLLKEFNDHSYQHIAVVLENVTNLIAKGTRKSISADEAAILALAVGLHDAAMHLDHEGLVKIIERNHVGTPLLGDRPWRGLWEEHIKWYRQMDREDALSKFKLNSPLILGDFELTSDSKNAVFIQGEFVRRHHHRIAQEFADSGLLSRQPGVPAPQVSTSLTFIKKLAGLVARSHGEPLRKHVDLLLELYKGEFRRPHGARVAFLMTLVRVGDYLHIGQDRATQKSRIFLPVSSNVARREWDINNAVVRDREGDPDNESQYFEIEPNRVTDLERYLRLRDYFRDLQSELDESWAVLGEVFGSRGPQIALRRVKTMLESDTFKKELSFVAEDIGVRISGPEVLSLLVGPLYDWEPLYAIRELQQNAFDAVLTLRELCRQKNQDTQEFNFYPIQGDIETSIQEVDPSSTELAVTDKGIGMDLATLRDYFLTAGGSYGRSPEWKAKMQNDDGANRISRRGKFGIGFLATFLVTRSVTVVTRRYDSKVGYCLILHKDSLERVEIIPLSGNDLPPIGTRISCKVSEAKHRSNPAWLYYDKTNWIATDEVLSSIKIGDESKFVKSPHPLLSSTGSPCWRTCEIESGTRVLWSLSNGPNMGIRSLNGMIVRDLSVTHNHSYVDVVSLPFFARGTLEIAIIDANSFFAINLQRSHVSLGRTREQITQSVARDSIARILTNVDALQGTNDARAISKVAHRNSLLFSHQGWYIQAGPHLTPSEMKLWLYPFWETNELVIAAKLLPDGIVMSLPSEDIPEDWDFENDGMTLNLYNPVDPEGQHISINLPSDEIVILSDTRYGHLDSVGLYDLKDRAAVMFHTEATALEKWIIDNGLEDIPMILGFLHGEPRRPQQAVPAVTNWILQAKETMIPYGSASRHEELFDWYEELKDDIARWREGFGFLPESGRRSDLSGIDPQLSLFKDI